MGIGSVRVRVWDLVCFSVLDRVVREVLYKKRHLSKEMKEVR